MSSLEGILDGAADAAKEIGDTLQQAADADQERLVRAHHRRGDPRDRRGDRLARRRSTPRSSRRRSSSRSRPRSPSSPRTSTPIIDPLVDDFDQAVEQSAVPGARPAARRAAEAARPGEAVRADDADRRRALDALPAAPPGDERIQAERAARPREAAARPAQEPAQGERRPGEGARAARAAVQRADGRLRLAEARRDRQAAAGRDRLRGQRRLQCDPDRRHLPRGRRGAREGAGRSGDRRPLRLGAAASPRRAGGLRRRAGADVGVARADPRRRSTRPARTPRSRPSSPR